MKRLLLATTTFLATGCLGGGEFKVRNTLDFDFNVHGLEWFGGAADFPQSQAGTVALVADLRTLPAPLNTSLNALYLSANNPGGDLFIFQKKHWDGLTPGTVLTVSLQLEFVTNYHAGCTTGPGPIAVLKAGATATEPVATADGQGILRMNIDKGTGLASGDFVQLGDIRNTETGCPAPGTFSQRTTLIKTQPVPLTVDLDGGFWTYLGVQSNFVGSLEIYVTAMRLVVESTE